MSRSRLLRALSRAEWLMLVGLVVITGVLLVTGLATWGIDYANGR